MGELRCVDGSLLGVAAVPCRDRLGQQYDLTLRLLKDSRPFAIVGQRCGHQLASLAAEVQAAREDPEQARSWPDPDDRFPAPAADRPVGVRAVFEPGEREYFTLRSQDRTDLPGNGEIRCVLRSTAHWHTDTGITSEVSRGYWRLRRRAVLEAWGERGTGVRAVLTSAELVMFLDTVLKEPDGWRRRGRVPDGSARSCLPALRAAARSVALAVAGAPTRGSDVRR